MVRSRARSLVFALLACGWLVLPAPPSHAISFANLWTFPGDCGAETTLQGCITNVAQPGDGIALETNGPINESITITKSLTLSPVAGYSPVITGTVFLGTVSTPINVHLTGITIEQKVSVSIGQGTSHITLDHIHLNEDAGTGGLNVGVAATSTVSFTDSTVSGSFEGHTAITYNANFSGGAATFDMERDQVSGGGAFSAGTAKGMFVSADNDIQVTLHIMSNTFSGFDGKALVFGTTGTTATYADVVGNTFDDNRYSDLDMSASPISGAPFTLGIFDNIFSNSQTGVYFEQAGPGEHVTWGWNDVYNTPDGNVWFGSPVGPILTANPGFVDEANGNLTLKHGSALIDAGAVCAASNIAAADLAGHARVAGRSVDVGAYERGSTATPGSALIGDATANTLIGTANADILCGNGGNDTLTGNGGNDYLDGGAGDDQLDGGAGSDRLFGGAGTDTLLGSGGSDPCLDAKDGVKANDSIDGGKGTDAYLADKGDARTNVELKGCA